MKIIYCKKKKNKKKEKQVTRTRESKRVMREVLLYCCV